MSPLASSPGASGLAALFKAVRSASKERQESR